MLGLDFPFLGGTLSWSNGGGGGGGGGGGRRIFPVSPMEFPSVN